MHEPQETQGEFEARIRRQREDQEAATERRQREQEYRKQVRAEEREQGVHDFDLLHLRSLLMPVPRAERKAAEKRREVKATKKKAEAEASRRNAEQKAHTQQERTQTLRSAVFAAARTGNIDKVKKGIWEDGVDAAGGEVKPGSEAFVKAKPKDAQETLAHVAAAKGNLDLFEWLDIHGKSDWHRRI